MKDSTEKICCKNCRHYYVTWDKDFPYGCKAMGFKSKNASAVVVLESSGLPCQHFERKGKQKRS